MDNLSDFKLFIYSGLQGSVYKPLYFLLAFVLYILIITVNLTLILTVIMEKNLHEPMYIFLSNLCVNSLFGTIGFYPKFLLDLLSDTHTVTYSWCLLQVYVIYSSVLSVSDVLYGWEGSEKLSVSERNALAIQFLIFPPLLNPIIYGLQLPQIRKVVCRQRCKHKILCKLKR
ncbi:olfactory receptor 5F1-like [Alosa sapidissima]|uniref:olfactory receptor 5F1-like n=1 Tax=Alosa sapidissima TaxID=34773 RepID=UPI001C08008F|nr:olfactory receptor 5F1-like [Alosa sapidissima]